MIYFFISFLFYSIIINRGNNMRKKVYFSEIVFTNEYYIDGVKIGVWLAKFIICIL